MEHLERTNFNIMKKITLSLLLIAVLLLQGHLTFAQGEKPKTLYDGKTEEQVLQEYKQWSGIKNDWANLGYYNEANAKLKSPAPDEKRVVFMGNSITEGWILTHPEYFKTNPYIDRGISGQTTPQMLIRFRADVIDLNPGIVVLLCGVNDIAQNTGPATLEMIENNIASMAELAKANGIKVILCSVLPAYDFPWKHGLEPAEKIVILNSWIKGYALEKGFIYLDYFSFMADSRNGLKAEYSEDGVHPNKEGYKVMEGLLGKVLVNIIE
jgi:lysophospholipase L1-like esterase